MLFVLAWFYLIGFGFSFLFGGGWDGKGRGRERGGIVECREVGEGNDQNIKIYETFKNHLASTAY